MRLTEVRLRSGGVAGGGGLPIGSDGASGMVGGGEESESTSANGHGVPWNVLAAAPAGEGG